MKTILKKQAALPVLALACCALWGSAPAAIKSGYAAGNIDTTASILLFAGIRFFLAGWMVLAFAWIRAFFSEKKTEAARVKENEKAGRENGKQSGNKSGKENGSSSAASFAKSVVTLALLQTFGQYFFYYLGAANASGVMVSVLSGCSALFALIFSAWLFHLEAMTPWKMTGCLLGLAGIVSMNMQGFAFSFSMAGEGMLLLSQICSALSAACIQLFSRKHSPVLLSGWQFVLGGAGLCVCGWIGGGSLDLNGLLVSITLWLSFVSAAAYTLWGILLSRYPVSSVGIYGCTIPLFGVLFSWLILKEVPGVSALMGLLLVAGGILCLYVKVPVRKSSIENQGIQ